ELGIGDPAIRTRKTLTEDRLARPIAVTDNDPAELLAVAEGDLERIGEAALHPALQDEAIDDDLDRMGLILRECQLFFQIVDLAVHSYAYEPRPTELLKLPPELALAPTRNRRQYLDAASFGQLANAVDDFGNRLRTDRLAATEAMRLADPGVEEAQEVVNLRDGADGRAGISPEPFLLDRNRRR